jgi:MscS family membrane protein
MWQQIQELLAIPIIRAMAILVGAMITAFVAEFVLQRAVLRLAERTKTDLDDRIVTILRRPIFLTAVFGGLYWAAATLHLHLGEGAQRVARAAIVTLAIVLWTGVIIRVGVLVLTALSARGRQGSLLQPSSLPLFDILFKVVAIGGALYFIFLAWNLDLTGWMASAGIIGVAVGFGARDSLSNLFAGIFILADAPYRIGDFVVLEDGTRGRVTTIGLRSTRILTTDDVEIVVPNGIIGNSRIQNEAGGPDIKHRLRTSVSVAYGSDIDQVRAVLLEAARATEAVCDEPPPIVRLMEFGDSGLLFVVHAWVDEPARRDHAIDALNTRIYKDLGAAGIEIPYNKHDVYIKEHTRSC